jgi:isoquinoline 1-oxidoreductase beta subunit
VTLTLTRREALKAGTAFVLGFHLPFQGQEQQVFEPNAWVRITRDNQITILTEIPELGQGTRTANAMMLADELEADWSAILWEQAPVIPSIHQHLSTGGSGGTVHIWLPMRQAGAQVREMLLTAAAERWRVPKAECRAENSAVLHPPTKRRLTYGEVAESASKVPPIDLAKVPLKPANDFRYIGKPIPRIDIPSKVNGSAIFGLDVRPPGMLFALIARCPHFGGRMVSFNGDAAKTTPGVKAVFAVPPIGFVPAIERNINVAGGVAVVANSTWAAMQGAKALKIVWDKPVDESTSTLQQQMRQAAAGPAILTCASHGDVSDTLSSSKKVEAEYEIPFQAHATMEPMNTTTHVRADGRIEVWSPTQIGNVAQKTIAALAGLPPEKVTVHMTLCGGSFGRRYQWDYLAESYQVAKDMKVPVQLVWTREDDMQHDFFLQYSHQRLTGALDAEGNITNWSHRIVSTPIRAIFDPPEKLKDPKAVASADVVDSIPYRAQNCHIDYAPVLSVVPRAWWRSVSAPFHNFSIECFVDELAHAAGQDPVAFRVRNLTPEAAKLRAVLELAAEKAEWGKPLPAGHGRGIAACIFGGTFLAQVAEVSVTSAGVLQVHRVVGAVDCGLAVNPDNVVAQIESGINYALTPVLSGEISFKNGAVEQSNFHNYQVLRMKDAPAIEVYLAPTGSEPRDGVGEAGVPPLAPSVANAVFAATGKRVRRLPILKV